MDHNVISEVFKNNNTISMKTVNPYLFLMI